MTEARTGHGCGTKDWRQAIPRVLCSDWRGRSRGFPVCDPRCSPFKDPQRIQEEVVCGCVNGGLHPFSLARGDGSREESRRDGMCISEADSPFLFLIDVVGLVIGL